MLEDVPKIFSKFGTSWRCSRCVVTTAVRGKKEHQPGGLLGGFRLKIVEKFILYDFSIIVLLHITWTLRRLVRNAPLPVDVRRRRLVRNAPLPVDVRRSLLSTTTTMIMLPATSRRSSDVLSFFPILPIFLLHPRPPCHPPLPLPPPPHHNNHHHHARVATQPQQVEFFSCSLLLACALVPKSHTTVLVRRHHKFAKR